MRIGPPFTSYTAPIPAPNHIRYPGPYLNKRQPHTHLKRIDFNRKFGFLRRLINSSSKLSLKNKMNIYKSILKPVGIIHIVVLVLVLYDS